MPRDWEAWKRQVLLAETFRAAPLSTRESLGQVDAGLAPWLRGHRYLRPVEVSEGECSMALLLLWEVEHGRSFPINGEVDRSRVLTGFTRRLLRRVAADEDLRLWLTAKEVQRPLAPGLPDTHGFRWAVRICAPPAGEPQGWYVEFTRRWREFLGSIAQPLGNELVVPAPQDVSSSSTSVPRRTTLAASRGRRRPRSVDSGGELPARRRAVPSARVSTVEDVAMDASAAVPSAAPPQLQSLVVAPMTRTRPRSPASAELQKPPKRQRDMRSWLTPKPSAPVCGSPMSGVQPDAAQMPASRHGRAVQGPPT